MGTAQSTATARSPSLSPEDYLQERVDGQIAWYDAKSVSHKRWYYGLQLLTLVAAALVPVVSLSSGELLVRIVVAISGSVAAVAAGIVSLYRFREQWVDYRVAAETLKAERYRFLTGAEPYAGDEAFARFVDRIESIITGENRRWREKDVGVDADGETSDRRADGEGADARSGHGRNASAGRVPGSASDPAPGPAPGPGPAPDRVPGRVPGRTAGEHGDGARAGASTPSSRHELEESDA